MFMNVNVMEKCPFNNQIKMDETLTGEEIKHIVQGIRTKSSHRKSEAIKKFPTIASQIGFEKTIEELLPFYVQSTTLTDSDIVNIITQFTEIDFQDLPKFLTKLLKIVKELTELDSVRIRNALSCLFYKICQNLNEETIHNIVFQYLLELVDSGYPPQQVTSFSIISRIAQFLDPTLFHEVLEKYESLEETSAQLQEAFIHCICAILSCCDDEEVKSKILDLLDSLIENSANSPLIQKSLLYLVKEQNALKSSIRDNIISTLIENFEEIDFRVQIQLIQTIKYLSFLTMNQKIIKLIQIKKITTRNVLLVQICSELHCNPVPLTQENASLCDKSTSKLIESVIEEFLESNYTPLVVQALQEFKNLLFVLDRNFVLRVLQTCINSQDPDIYLAALGTLAVDQFTPQENLNTDIQPTDSEHNSLFHLSFGNELS